MGYIWTIGVCCGCERVFGFNADRVPSLRINGAREPICQACVDRVNPRRVANGLSPIVPLPGAYLAVNEHDGSIADDDDM